VTGSGLLIDSQGTIVTPASLVAGSQQVTVSTAAGKQYTATVLGTDPASDVAVIRVTDAAGLSPLTLGDSSAVQLGDVVVAVGNQVAPSGTVSQGIVSGTAGMVSVGSATVTGLIQTTAPMPTGTSGSALVNIDGHVIGMTTLGSSGSAGLGVAITSNQVIAIVKKFAGSGTPSGTPTLGLTATDAPGAGALVQSVVTGGPAARAGVQAGWTIVSIGGHPVPNAAAIPRILATYKAGDQVVLTVQLPNASTRSVSVVLGA
jgi:putative serine protease PepD